MWSESCSLARLIATLGEPTRSHDRGDPVSSRNPEGRKRQHAFWALESRHERTELLQRHIDELVVFAETHADAFATLPPDSARNIFCGIFSAEQAQGGVHARTRPDPAARRADAMDDHRSETSSIETDSEREAVLAVLEDGTRVPEWAPPFADVAVPDGERWLGTPRLGGGSVIAMTLPVRPGMDAAEVRATLADELGRIAALAP